MGFSSILVPAIAQSIAPDFLSTRRSRNHSPTEITIVSVVSSGGSGTHRSEMRVVKLLDEPSAVPVVAMVNVGVCGWSFGRDSITNCTDGRY